MKPNRSIWAGFTLLLYLAPSTSSIAQLIVGGPSGLRMDVMARVSGTGGQVQEIAVNEDSMLRTGDGVQIRLHAARDAYVYVIVYGSSQSAVVLHPFSGRSEDAFMRAGEDRFIPGPNGFLRLDRRAGEESFFAFASPEPVRFMSSLLVRMEARGGDRKAVAEILRASHPEVLALSFRHVEGSSTAARGPETGLAAATASEPAASASAPAANAVREVEEEGVLSGEGSRIDAFISGSASAGGGAAVRPEVVATSTPEAPTAPPAAVVPEPAPEPKSSGWFGRLFSFESNEPSRPPADPPVEEVIPATTYALPATESEKVEPEAGTTGSVITTAGAQDTEIPPVLSARLATAEGGTEATIRSAERSPVVPKDVDPQLNVSVLDAIVVSLGEMPERNRGIGTEAESVAGGAGSETPPSTTSMQVAERRASAPAAVPEPETRQIGTDGGLPDAPEIANAPESAGGKQSPVAQSATGPSMVEQPTVEEAPGATSNPVIGVAPSPEPEPASRTVVIGPSNASPTPATSATNIGNDTPAADVAAGPSSGPEPAGAETGILSGLASLFGGSSGDTGNAGAGKTPSAATSGSGPEPGADPGSAPRPNMSPSPASGEQVGEPETSTSTSGGFFSGLTGWFSSSPTEAAQSQDAEVSGEQVSTSPVVATRPPPDEQAAAATPETTGGEGIFGGLSRLFGGNTTETPKPDEGDQSPRATVTPQKEPAPEPGEPAFKTVTRADGKQVVIVPGPPARPDTSSTESTEVLTGAGSKIRALLEPEKATAPEKDVVAEVRQQSAVPANPPPEQPNAATVRASGQVTDVSRTPVKPEAAASAATVGRSPEVAVSPPVPVSEGAASVAPDGVQTALEAGEGVGRPSSQTIAALTAPAPVVSVAPVREIDVTAADNVSSSIVLVVTPGGTGSGVLLDDAGHVLANWHLVNGYSTVSVSFKMPNLGMPSTERTFSARVLRLNKTADLALLRVDSPPADVRPVRFADAGDVKAGAVLHAIGHPASGAWTHTLGKIDDVKPESSWYAGRNLLHRGTVIQAKVLDDPGSAGAPLFNNRMEFVGISAAGRSKKGVLTGVSVDTIRLFLEAPPPGG